MNKQGWNRECSGRSWGRMHRQYDRWHVATHSIAPAANIEQAKVDQDYGIRCTRIAMACARRGHWALAWKLAQRDSGLSRSVIFAQWQAFAQQVSV